ncbi:HD domain-containing phosphohydrolase [Marispirochaeta aestuarii]|uniref:HD domain-containing phosphohydrolase n=1 Tax=Marispirochaeta aestuarii TaxID=1963862 RepID=UPI002ABDAB00|nr:HD domain-containing phosphohydrolase [Marispirochaeta aestuarii]
MSSYIILFVDDEYNILQSLKRLFFEYPEFEILTALSAEEGAGILATRQVDVLISDEKMPKIAGSQFVHYVKERFPDVVRCILTGYANPENILKAVNKGEVYRYLVKPWNDGDLISTIRSAAEYGRLKRYNRELETQLKAQNESLKKEVARRTAYLQKALTTVKSEQAKAEETLGGIVTLLSHMIGLVHPEMQEFSSRAARLAERIAVAMELEQDELYNIRTAALLQEIGLFEANSGDHLNADHAEDGARLLNKLSALGPIAILIKHHHERFDGKGDPGGLSGEEIPLGSRIIRTAADYVRLIYEERMERSAALEKMTQGVQTIYDPQVIRILRDQEAAVKDSKDSGIPIQIKNLGAGMVLKNDLILKNGVLVLPKNTALTQSMVEHLPNYRFLNPEETVYLRAVPETE